MRRAGGITDLQTTQGEVRAHFVIACAGLYADRVAAMTGSAADPHIVPFAATISCSRHSAAGSYAARSIRCRIRATVLGRALHAARRRLGVARPERGARLCPRRLLAADGRPPRPAGDAALSGFSQAGGALLADGRRGTVSRRRPARPTCARCSVTCPNCARGLQAGPVRRAAQAVGGRRFAGGRLRDRRRRGRAERAQRAVARRDVVARDRAADRGRGGAARSARRRRARGAGGKGAAS